VLLEVAHFTVCLVVKIFYLLKARMSLALILEPQKLLVWDSDFPVSAHIAFQLAVS
jgi:hypothetical protein